MSGSNIARLNERKQIAKETRELLVRLRMETPTYFPTNALVELQKYVGYRAKSNARSRRKQTPFSSTEMPRAVPLTSNELPRPLDNGVSTPSWFRYANIDGQDQDYAPMPDGYHWDVEYFRREDGCLITQPALVEIPPMPTHQEGQVRSAKFSEFARALDLNADLLDDEGIEDISSDEDMYMRGDHMFVPEEEDDSSDDEIDLSNEIAPAPGRLSENLLRPRSRFASSSSSALSVAQEVSSSEQSRRAAVTSSGGSKRKARRGVRVDSRRATSAELSNGDGDGDVEMSEEGSERGSLQERTHVGGQHVDDAVMVEDDDDEGSERDGRGRVSQEGPSNLGGRHIHDSVMILDSIEDAGESVGGSSERGSHQGQLQAGGRHINDPVMINDDVEELKKAIELIVRLIGVSSADGTSTIQS